MGFTAKDKFQETLHARRPIIKLSHRALVFASAAHGKRRFKGNVHPP